MLWWGISLFTGKQSSCHRNSLTNEIKTISVLGPHYIDSESFIWPTPKHLMMVPQTGAFTPLHMAHGKGGRLCRVIQHTHSDVPKRDAHLFPEAMTQTYCHHAPFFGTPVAHSVTRRQNLVCASLLYREYWEISSLNQQEKGIKFQIQHWWKTYQNSLALVKSH